MRSTAFIAAAFAALGVALCASQAQAAGQTANASLTVQANVSDACSVANATLSFGSITPTNGTTLPVTGFINVTCTLGTTFSVGLGDGLNANGSTRRMRRASTSDYLTYTLEKDLLGNRFGDTGASDRSAGIGTGISLLPIDVIGKVPSGQSGSPGAYSDTVQITLYY